MPVADNAGMGIKIGISIDSAGTFEQVTALLAPSTVRSDLYRAMNESIAKVKTLATRDVRSQYKRLNANMFTGKSNNPFVSVSNKLAGKDDLSASFSIKGRRVTLGRYGTSAVNNYGRQTAPPKFSVKSSKSIAYSFAVANSTLPNTPNVFNQGKGYQIFSRVGGNMGKKFKSPKRKGSRPNLSVTAAMGAVKKVVPKKGSYAGKVYVRGPLKGQPYRRQPIQIFRNIAISEMFNTKRQGAVSYSQLEPIFNERMISRIESSFKSQLRRQFKKLF